MYIYRVCLIFIFQLLPESRIIRVALNTPVAVLSAVSVFCAGSHAISDDIETVRKMMSSVGSCFVMDEKHLDTVTALAGSGPAYVRHLLHHTFILTSCSILLRRCYKII